MATSMRIKLDRKGVRRLANDQGLQIVVLDMAQDIAGEAGPGFEAKAGHRTDRVRAVVVATTREAILAEQRDRALTRAIRAGRRT